MNACARNDDREVEYMVEVVATYNEQGRLIGIKGRTTPKQLREQMMALSHLLGDNDGP